MDVQLSQSQKQVQRLSQSMRQSLEILQMSTRDLDALVRRECKKNPTIEIVPRESFRRVNGSSPDDHQGFLESVQYAESLQEHILAQIVGWDQHKKDLLLKLLELLDDRGFLKLDTQSVVAKLKCTRQVALDLINNLKNLHPNGLGSKDLKEFLKIQLANVSSKNGKIALEIVDKYFDELKNKKIDYICSATKLPKSKVIDAGKLIAHMNFSPISGFRNDLEAEIIPDVKIYKKDGEWCIDLNSESVPEIRYSESYKNIVNERDTIDKKAWLYLKAQSGSARKLQNAILRRGETLVSIAKEILAVQMDFFENGEKFLRVLRLRDVARRIHMNTSTICRAVNGKYVDTPYGIKPMTFFFSSGERNVGGFSKGAIISRISEILSSSNRKLTDNEIVEILESDGIHIARRTVSKYRKSAKLV